MQLGRDFEVIVLLRVCLRNTGLGGSPVGMATNSGI